MTRDAKIEVAKRAYANANRAWVKANRTYSKAERVSIKAGCAWAKAEKSTRDEASRAHDRALLARYEAGTACDNAFRVLLDASRVYRDLINKQSTEGKGT